MIHMMTVYILLNMDLIYEITLLPMQVVMGLPKLGLIPEVFAGIILQLDVLAMI